MTVALSLALSIAPLAPGYATLLGETVTLKCSSPGLICGGRIGGSETATVGNGVEFNVGAGVQGVDGELEVQFDSVLQFNITEDKIILKDVYEFGLGLGAPPGPGPIFTFEFKDLISSGTEIGDAKISPEDESDLPADELGKGFDLSFDSESVVLDFDGGELYSTGLGREITTALKPGDTITTELTFGSRLTDVPISGTSGLLGIGLLCLSVIGRHRLAPHKG
jgi:hypothetical protein